MVSLLSDCPLCPQRRVRVRLRPLNVGITITSGQWMSQTQTKDIGIISFIWGHYTHILHVIFVFSPMKAEISDSKYAFEGIVWVGIFSSDLSAFISQAGRETGLGENLGYFYSLMDWASESLGSCGDWQTGYTHLIYGPWAHCPRLGAWLVQ